MFYKYYTAVEFPSTKKKEWIKYGQVAIHNFNSIKYAITESSDQYRNKSKKQIKMPFKNF